MWQWAVRVYVGNVYGCVSSVLCVGLWEVFRASPVAAAEQEPQDLASSLVLFFR